MSVGMSVYSLLRYRLNVFLPPLPKVRCPIFLEIQNPWEKALKEVVSDLNIFVGKWSKSAAQFIFVFDDFSFQNMVETTLPGGLETSGRRAYR